MWKGIVVGTAALAIVGSSVIYAQERFARPDDASAGARAWRTGGHSVRRGWPALKAGLALSAEQEKNWPAFEQAAREFAKLRLDRMDAMRSSPAERRSGRPHAPSRRRDDWDRHRVAEIGRRHRPALQEPRRQPEATLCGAEPHERDANGWLAHGRPRPRLSLPSLARGRPSGRVAAAPDDGRPARGRRAQAVTSRIWLAAAVALPAPRHDRRRKGSRRAKTRRLSLFVERALRAPMFFGRLAGQPGIPLLHDARLGGSPRRHFGRIAQLVEQLTLNQRVQGSSPCAPTTKIKHLWKSVGPGLPRDRHWEGHGKSHGLLEYLSSATPERTRPAGWLGIPHPRLCRSGRIR